MAGAEARRAEATPPGWRLGRAQKQPSDRVWEVRRSNAFPIRQGEPWNLPISMIGALGRRFLVYAYHL
jgi:hypothetical protein